VILRGVDWRLDVRYREKTFSGRVVLHFEETPDPLTVDASRLRIDSTLLDGRPVSFREDTARGTLTFSGFSAGPHLLEIAYRGAADPDALVGFYVAPAGKRYVLTTMFFPTGSRRLLPSFEHPSVKTVYRLVLTTDSDVTAVFNTAPISHRTEGDRQEITFAPTPPMSAYLLYLGVGPFDTIKVPGDPWSVTVAASPGRAYAGRYCAERASELVAAYEKYYGVPYPLPKLDLVALENFWAGAMENWGAIAFREDDVLVDPATTALERRVSLVVLAHETAHQWFGNLVTPADWDDFWLNESFATFASFSVVGRNYPSELAWNYFMARYLAPALQQDSLPSTRPVKTPVSSVDQLNEIVDDITYGKGAAVLRMVESYLGEDAFRAGLSQYLTKYRYANARAEDLWASLQEASAAPVSRIMAEWITRPGYPVIRARWSNGTLSLRQQRFRANGDCTAETWPILLRVSSPSGDVRRLFDSASTEVVLPSFRGLRINPGRTAFARTYYDEALFGHLLEEFESLSPIDQFSLATDTLAFVYAGMTPLSDYLRLVRVAMPVAAELPVHGIVDGLLDLASVLYDRREFSDVSRQFLSAQMARIGVDRRAGEAESSQLEREVVSAALVRTDPEFARELAVRVPEIDKVIPELRPSVSLAYAASGGPKAFDDLVERLRATLSEAARAQLLRALSGFVDPALLRRALDLVPGPVVPSASTLSLFRGMSMNPRSAQPFFDWYRERSSAIRPLWAGTPLLATVLESVLPPMGRELEEPVERYFREHPAPEARIGIERGLEKMRLRARLRREVTQHPSR